MPRLSTSRPADTVALPDSLSFEQGAAIPVNYATAWAALHGYGSLRAGERVLIHAAAGGVGIAAIQLAKAAGAEVHGTASPGKHQRLAELGIDRAIDYRRGGWWKDLQPYDIVLDALGGASLRRLVSIVAPWGTVGGATASPIAAAGREAFLSHCPVPEALPMLRGFNLIKQLQESKAVIGLNMLALWDDRGTLEPWIGPLLAALADGTVSPVLHAAVPFADAPGRPTGSLPHGRTWARWFWCRDAAEVGIGSPPPHLYLSA